MIFLCLRTASRVGDICELWKFHGSDKGGVGGVLARFGEQKEPVLVGDAS